MAYTKITTEQLKHAVKYSTSLSDLLRNLGRAPVGGNSTAISLRLRRENIDTTHFVGQAHAKGKPSRNKKPASEYLVLGTDLDYRQKGYTLTRCLLEIGIPYRCNECGIDEWRGKRICLEVDHINETYWDNRPENLQFLCPNCHTMKEDAMSGGD